MNNFLEKGVIVNSDFYWQILRQNSPYLLNDPWSDPSIT